MKRTIFLLLLGLFMINFAAAADWDNVYNYDEETKTATIENWFGIGGDLAYVTLTSPQNKMVAPYVDTLVGEFNFTTTGDFMDTFGDIYLEDKRTGNEMSRGKQFKYKKYTDVLVDDYETVCTYVETLGNGTIIENCEEVEVGNHWEVQMDWIPIINPTNFFLDGVTYEIGVFVDVEVGDWGEWIPHIMGVDIEEWAEWEASLNTGIIKFIDFENSTLYDRTNNIYNDTAGGSPTFPGTGIIGNNLACSGNDWVEMSAGRDWQTTDSTYSVSLWVKGSSGAGTQMIYDLRENTDRVTIQIVSGGVKLALDNNGAYIWSFGTTGNLIDGAWHHLVYTQNGSETKLFTDGASVVNTTSESLTMGTTPGGAALCANGGLFTNAPFTGEIDEMGIWNRTLTGDEIINYYNVGSPPYYQETIIINVAPNITLNSPASANYSTLQTPTINFTAWDDTNLTNVTMTVNDVINQSNSTGVNNSVYLFPLTLGDGDYTIYGTATDNDSEQTNSSSIRIVIDSTVPTITLVAPANLTAYNSSWSNISINFSSSDTNGLDTCWYNTAGIDSIIACNTNISYIILNGTNTITYFANDTFGNVASDQLLLLGGPFIVNISNATDYVIQTNGSSSWEENVNLTFNSSAPSTGWFSWFVDGVSKLAGIGENVFNWVFNLPSEAPNATVNLKTSSFEIPIDKNSFNNSLTEENITFDGNESYSRWINITKDVNISAIDMELSGYGVAASYESLADPGLPAVQGGITSNETHFWITDVAGDTIDMYLINGTFISDFAIDDGGPVRAITNNGTHLFTMEIGSPSTIRVYLFDGTSVENLTLTENNMVWIATNDTNLFFGSAVRGQELFIANMTGTITETYHAPVFGSSDIEAATYLAPWLYVYDSNDEKIYRGNLTVADPGDWYEVRSLVKNIQGMGNDGNKFYFTDGDTDNITTMLINDPTYPTGSYVDISGTQVWSYTGAYSSVGNQTSDFTSTINAALNSGACDCSGCDLSGTDCLIEFIFHSDTSGDLEYSSINLTYDNDVDNQIFQIQTNSVNPALQLISPTSINYTTLQTTINFSTSDVNLDTCWYNIGGANITTNCALNVTGLNSGQGESTWTIYSNDSVGNENSSSATFFVDSINPAVLLIYPITTNYSAVQTIINFSASDTNLDTCWYSVNATSNITTSCIANITGLAAAQGSNTWTIYANDTFGNENSSSVAFNVDSILPVISISAPIARSDYGKVGNNETLSITITDTNLDSCWYNYNGTNITIAGCLTGVLNSTNFTIEVGVQNVTVYANDTIGNENSATRSWAYALLENSQTYTSPVYETSQNNMSINLSYTSTDWSSVAGYLVYNGTSTIAAAVTSATDIILSKSFTAEAVAAEINKSFYWIVQLTNSTSTYNYTTDTRNQTIQKVGFSLCNYSDNPQLFFKTFDTLNPTDIVNATFASAWTINNVNGGDEVLSTSFEDTTESNSSWGFCIGPNSTNYTISVGITVEAINYTSTTHYIIDTDYDNETNNISLYLLHDDDSTLTQIKTTDKNNIPVQDVYTTIQRYDVGTDTYYNVAMTRSDSNGEDLVYLSWYDDWYRFVGIYNAEVVFSEGPKRISETPQIFKIDETADLDYEKFDNILYSLTYNNATQNFILTYVDPSGLVSANCLKVIKRTLSSDELICETCEASSSATVYCNIAANGNGTFVATYYATGSPAHYIDILIELINVQADIYSEIGNLDGTAMAILIAGVVLALFLITPALGILGAILGVVLAVALGFQPFDYLTLAGIIVVGAAMMWAVQK